MVDVEKVDWYPWGEEAFELARKKDVPIFLSSCLLYPLLIVLIAFGLDVVQDFSSMTLIWFCFVFKISFYMES